VDIQNFIDRFSKANKKEKAATAKGVETTTPDEPNKVLSHPLVIEMRNEYESKLMQKAIEIRQRDATLDQIRRIIGGAFPADGAPVARVNGSSGNVAIWIEKLGSTRAAGKILAFLNEKHGMKFTRSQICLAIGISSRGGNTTDAFATLKRNKLVIEQGGEIWINPDL